MIILHSLKILEQLSQIEDVITKLETKLESMGVEYDREELLKQILNSREVAKTSRNDT